MQGHVAYPHRADNPVPDIVAADRGADATSRLTRAARNSRPRTSNSSPSMSATAPSTSFPARRARRFNIRYNDLHTQASLRELVEHGPRKPPATHPARIVWEPSNSHVFLHQARRLHRSCGRRDRGSDRPQAQLSTTGGTSDARFIASYCPVIEFGLLGQTMHQVDERVPLADLKTLTAVYRGCWTAILRELSPLAPLFAGLSREKSRIGEPQAIRAADFWFSFARIDWLRGAEFPRSVFA